MKFALDTNILFNMEAQTGLGNTTKEIVKSISRAVASPRSDRLEIIIPPRIADEIETFFESPDDPVLLEFLGSVIVLSPPIHDISLNADIVRLLVQDYRTRAFTGLGVAEEELEGAAKEFMGKSIDDRKAFQIAVGGRIRKLRERYRNATRTGTLDSDADFDLILLSKAHNASLVSSDEGVINWARRIGVQETSSRVFGTAVQAYL